MAWRFKASKYKNAAPIVPKVEMCVREVCVGSYQTYGNNICASASLMAFPWEHAGASMAVLPLDDAGRKSKTMPLLHAHTDTVTGMEFSPFHDGLLATGSQDCLVKIWHIPETGLSESLSTAECTLSQRQRRVETLGFHPVADGLLHVTSSTTVSLWDLTTQQEAFSNSSVHSEVIQSSCWKRDGALLATSCKDKRLRVLDPRAAADACVVLDIASHQNIKDSRVVWLGDTDKILTTGFDASRVRQVALRDVRRPAQPLHQLELQCSTGVLVPLYDPDTGMLFLAGKGDTTVLYMELLDRDPYFVEGLRHSGEQTKGACLVPKRALRVMEGEVNRLLQLTSSSVIPITYQVPRKTYRDYHADLYPDTAGCHTTLAAAAWLAGHNHILATMSLDPAKRNQHEKPRLGPKPFSMSQGSEEFSFDKVFSVPAAPGQLSSPASPPASKEPPRKISSPTSDVDATTHKDGDYSNGKSDSSVEEEVNSEDSGYKPKTPGTADRRKMFETELSGGGDTVDDMQLERGGARGSIAQRRRLYERSTSHQDQPKSPTLLRRRDSLKARKSPEEEKRVAAGTKRTSTVFGRVSKFRHLKGTPLHKSTHIENIKNISRQISAESNGFHGNGYRVAVSVGGGGGRVAVLELPAGATPVSLGASDLPRTAPALLHAAALCDWRFDPFRPDRLVVACDDGAVREWIIPDGGLKESTNEPARSWPAHADKMSVVEWHPRAADLLATAGHDLALRLWDLSPQVPVLWRALLGHTDQIHALAWSPCGNYLATVCKDGLIRIFKPRASCEATSSGRGPAGGRGARVVWALDGTHLVVTGFDKVSERQVLVYSVTDLSAPLTTLGLDVSPAILQPHYDEDSATLFLTGRGDSTIYCLEVCAESPWLQALSHHRAASLHQGVAWLHRNMVQAERVEFARALRLASANIEPLSFTVPRVRSELFQDDLFPDTRVTWEASCSAAEWIAGYDAPVQRVSLRPPGMELLSEHTATPAPVQAASGGQAADRPAVKSAPIWSQAETKGKQDEILKSMSARMEVNLSLEQDSMEGVDEAEWEQ